MKIIKRSGTEVTFDIDKIMAAVSKANNEVVHSERLSDEQIEMISKNVEDICQEMNRSLSVEEIQDLVENQIMNLRAFAVARKYITYRYKRALVRKSNSTDEQILSLLECNNEEVKQENSNKNPTVNSVQRDYMAGEVSKDITKRLLLPQDIVDAHEQGLIHFHDADYFAQHMHNCCLVNLEDMLQNGTVISETMLEKPHSFSTACNIATQAIAQIASSQYGGQSISLAHLAPFVQISREKFIRKVREEFEKAGIDYTEEKVREVAEMRGKTINAIIDECGVKIDITDDGFVSVCGLDQAGMDQAMKYIKTIVNDFVEGEIYEGKVVSIKEFGAFIEFAPGKEGMVHISKVANERIEHVEDVLTLGDHVKCKCMGKDKMGRISFSIKDAQ